MNILILHLWFQAPLIPFSYNSHNSLRRCHSYSWRGRLGFQSWFPLYRGKNAHELSCKKMTISRETLPLSSFSFHILFWSLELGSASIFWPANKGLQDYQSRNVASLKGILRIHSKASIRDFTYLNSKVGDGPFRAPHEALQQARHAQKSSSRCMFCH